LPLLLRNMIKSWMTMGHMRAVLARESAKLSALALIKKIEGDDHG